MDVDIKKNIGNISFKNFDDEFVDNSFHVLKEDSFERNHLYLCNPKVNGVLKPVNKNVFMEIHGISRDGLESICHLLLQNETLIDKRSKSRIGNAQLKEICVVRI